MLFKGERKKKKIQLKLWGKRVIRKLIYAVSFCQTAFECGNISKVKILQHHI